MGAKAAYELFPGGLKQRLQKERKKQWAEKQRAAVADAVAAVVSQARQAKAGPGLQPAEELKKQKEEVEARVKLLSELDEKYEDLGERCCRYCMDC